jgi:polysaccharide pyruvyl transferase CsaB
MLTASAPAMRSPVPSATAPVLLCGYYGEHNLGDDALLQALLAQLPAGCPPLVTAHDQELVRRRFGVATTDRRSLRGVLRALAGCRALVLGGGSLLQDSTSFRSLVYYALLIGAARLRGLPVILWAQGLGPLRRRRSRLLVARLLPLVAAASWRDPASAALGSRMGLVGVVGSDPVWSLEPRPWHGSGGPLVVCWRPVQQLEGEAWRPWLEALAALARRHDREVLWVPFHRHQDTGLLARLQQAGLAPEDLFARSREVTVEDPNGAAELFASAGLVLAMRLHGLILAAQAGSPCAALSYDPKVAAAAAAIGCPCHDLAIAAEPGLADTLSQAWDAVLDQPPPQEPLQELRRQAEAHRSVLAGLG